MKRSSREQENKIILGVWIFVLAFLLLSCVIFLVKKPVTVSFIKIGQGDAALISAGREGNVLIDGGDDGAGFLLKNYLELQNVEELDGVFLSHFHKDHVNGILELMLDGFPIKKLYLSEHPSHTELEEEMLKLAEKQGIPIVRVKEGDILQLGKATYRVISQNPYTNEENLNDMSMILRVEYGESSVLFTGDMEKSGAGKLAEDQGEDLEADVIKIPHHGGASSLNREFLEAASPTWAVISVGSNNYGMPSEVVLAELLALHIGIYRTDRDGTVVVTLGKDGVRNISYTPQWR